MWRASHHGLYEAEPPTETETITCPARIVWGDRDHLVPREQQEQLAAAIPGSTLLSYEDTGHLVLWEQPEQVARDLTGFVELLRSRPTC